MVKVSCLTLCLASFTTYILPIQCIVFIAQFGTENDEREAISVGGMLFLLLVVIVFIFDTMTFCAFLFLPNYRCKSGIESRDI